MDIFDRWLFGIGALVLMFTFTAVAHDIGETRQRSATCEIAGGVLLADKCVNRQAVIVLDQDDKPKVPMGYPRAPQ